MKVTLDIGHRNSSPDKTNYIQLCSDKLNALFRDYMENDYSFVSVYDEKSLKVTSFSNDEYASFLALVVLLTPKGKGRLWNYPEMSTIHADWKLFWAVISDLKSLRDAKVNISIP